MNLIQPLDPIQISQPLTVEQRRAFGSGRLTIFVSILDAPGQSYLRITAAVNRERVFLPAATGVPQPTIIWLGPTGHRERAQTVQPIVD